MIIGAGGRVVRDVVPAIEALGSYRISSIFAHREGALFGSAHEYQVRQMLSLTLHDIQEAAAIYVAIPPRSIGAVLGHIAEHPCAHIDLIIDTPAITSPRLRELYGKFRSVQVAEDSVFVPWLEVVRSALQDGGALGPLKKIVIDRAAYRYHAAALAKKLISLDGTHRRYAALRLARRTYIFLRDGIRSVIVGPYDPARGSITIVGKHATASDCSRPGHIPIECIENDGRCTGFRLGAHTAALSAIESELIGPWKDTDTIVTRMTDLKRVGLYRLLKAVSEGQPIWPLAEGLDDASISIR